MLEINKMRRLLNIDERRKLCTQIATIYQQRVEEGITYGNAVIPSMLPTKTDTAKAKGLTKTIEIAKKQVKCIKTMLATRNVIEDLRKKNEEYDKLAKSRLEIYFVRTQSLKNILKELEGTVSY
jgi:hypothetical protein